MSNPIEWVCEFVAVKDSSSPKFGSWSIEVVENFCSSTPDFYNWICFEFDFNFEDDRFKDLEDGEYIIYARGTSFFESDRDWESGIEEGGWILETEFVAVTKLIEGSYDYTKREY